MIFLRTVARLFDAGRTISAQEVPQMNLWKQYLKAQRQKARLMWGGIVLVGLALVVVIGAEIVVIMLVR